MIVPVSSGKNILSAATDRISLGLAVVAAILLLTLGCVIAIGVGARYFFGAPILGVNEIIQLNAVALVAMGLPYCTHSGAHVRADILDPFIGIWGRFVGDVLTRVLSIIALGYLVSRAWAKALDAHEFGDATNMLNLPLWPFYGLIAFGMAACILVFAMELIDILSRRKPVDE